MCGPDTSNKPRGGALAVLSSAATQWGGELAFYTTGAPASSVATHARLTASDDSSLSALSDAVVLIHKSGDMSILAEECGLFERLAFAQATRLPDGTGIELELATPMAIIVGDNGIIGRRVSIFRRVSEEEDELSLEQMGPSMAEGIIGFNFMPSL